MTYGPNRADNPNLRRWMAFVDGENFTIGAQRLMKGKNSTLQVGPLHSPNEFVWFADTLATQFAARPHVTSPAAHWNPRMRVPQLQPLATRAYYYTSVVGDEPKIVAVKEALWRMGFHPEVFKKAKRQDKAKGVDVALTKDLLSNAFLDNYDVAVLYAGDGDYVPLVEEVKRLGKVVCVAYFGNERMSENLRLASDVFIDVTHEFSHSWAAWHQTNKLVEGAMTDLPSLDLGDPGEQPENTEP